MDLVAISEADQTAFVLTEFSNFYYCQSMRITRLIDVYQNHSHMQLSSKYVLLKVFEDEVLIYQ